MKFAEYLGFKCVLCTIKYKNRTSLDLGLDFVDVWCQVLFFQEEVKIVRKGYITTIYD